MVRELAHESLTKITVGLFLLIVAAPALAGPVDACGPGGGLIGVNPVANGSFEVGFRPQIVTASGATGAYAVAPGWAVTVANESRLPASQVGWSDNHGSLSSGAIWVKYDATDAGNSALSLRQDVGVADVGGPFCGADEVVFDLATTGAFTARAVVHDANGAYSTDTITIGPGIPAHPRGTPTTPSNSPPLTEAVSYSFNLKVAPGAGTLERVEIVLEQAPGADADGAWAFVDNVAVFGTSTAAPPA